MVQASPSINYFESNYDAIFYPIDTDDKEGLRNAQLGAIHAIGAHFTIEESKPAIVIMPTGSGKTAVMIMSPFLLRAKRILIMSSSVLVRGQLTEEISTLKTLKKISVVNDQIKLPKVKEIKEVLKSKKEWDNLSNVDVTIGIPKSLDISHSPDINLFDLILVDEAHHSPANSWESVLDYFTNSRKILFTATPFRRDKKEIDGKFIYRYPLSKAKADKIFGSIGYFPIQVADEENQDVVLAKATEKIFKEDREKKLDHYLMVRTDSKKHANELVKVYENNTSLKLSKIDSSKTYRTIKKVIEDLKNKKIDGIICVDMLGEGFDFPNLKIAALHAPHKSLAITLQFIGRFARTNVKNIGQAKFLAVPNEIKILKTQLYAEDAIWDDLIVNLSDAKSIEEDKIKENLDKFEKRNEDIVSEDVSLFNIEPYCHVKIYKIYDYISPSDIEIPGHTTIKLVADGDLHTFVLITKEITKPKWLISDEIINSNYYLFIVFYDFAHRLLFINSAYKTNEFYDYIASFFTTVDKDLIPKIDLHKVLHGLTENEFFNIGMLNRSFNSGESYRIMAGNRTDKNVRKSDGRIYSNGHVFGKAINENKESITIGYSSGSKVWSNIYLKIPIFIDWCKNIGKKINSNVKFKTNTGLDNLPIGVRIEKLPFPAFAATWNKASFLHTPFISIIDRETGEVLGKYQLLDFEISIEKLTSTLEILQITLSNPEYRINILYSLSDHFRYTASDYDFKIDDETDLVEYLNENPLQFYLEDFSMVIYGELHSTPGIDDLKYDVSLIKYYDWDAINTDIRIEFYDDSNPKIIKKVDNNGKNSIQESLEYYLKNENPEVLIFDHGTGEIADFITISQNNVELIVNLYHCKGTTGENAGLRVDDLYEVCGQSIKCLMWTNSKLDFEKKLTDRLKGNMHKFLLGNLTKLTSITKNTSMISFNIFIIQPGLSVKKLSEPKQTTNKMTSILAAADDYIRSSGNNEKLFIYGSNK